MSSQTRKTVLACCFSAVILLICLIVLTRVEGLPSLGQANLNAGVVVLFFLSVSTIYAFSMYLWQQFYALFGEKRAGQDSFIDMGLIAIGKYLPGKIWGILFRGAVSSQGMQISKNQVVTSAAEQVYALLVGCLLVGYLLFVQTIQAGIVWITVGALVMLLLCVVTLRVMFRYVLSHRLLMGEQFLSGGKPGFVASAGLALGYVGVWILSALPLLILIVNSETFSLQQLASIAAAFMASMIAGFIAIFAPGGIGVRETVFVFLAPVFMSWQDGLFWITLHRALFTLFDLVYGCVALGLVAYRSRKMVPAK